MTSKFEGEKEEKSRMVLNGMKSAEGAGEELHWRLHLSQVNSQLDSYCSCTCSHCSIERVPWCETVHST